MSKSDNVFDSDHTNETPSENRSRTVLRSVGFLALMVVFFLVSFYAIGPLVHRGSVAPPSDRTNLSNEEWGQAPAPAPAPPTTKEEAPGEAQVEVSEISPGSPGPAATKPGEPQEDLSVTLSPQREPTPPKFPAPRSGAPTATAPRSKPAQERGFCVQAGAFNNRTNAETVANALADLGYSTSVKLVARNGTTVYLTLVGNPKTKDEAERLAAELRDAGRDVAVVPVE